MTIPAELDRAAHRIHTAERIVPSVLKALDERRANIIQSRTQGGRHGGTADPTARIVVEFADIDTHRAFIAQGVQIIHAAINHLDQLCRSALGGPLASAEDAPRCPGYPAGTTCGELTTYTLDHQHGPVLRADRLCDRHGRDRDTDDRRQRDAARKRLERTGART